MDFPRWEQEMTNYIPKYQFEGVTARRSGKKLMEFKYQRLCKSGKWGKVKTGDNKYNSHKTPQEIIDYWNEINPDTKFRLVEE